MSLETAVVVIAIMSVIRTAFMGMSLVNSIQGRLEHRAERTMRERLTEKWSSTVDSLGTLATKSGPPLGYTVIPCGTSGGDIAHWHVVAPDGTFVGDEHETESSAREIAAMLNARHGYMQ